MRDEATDRLYDTLREVLSPRQRVILETLLEVPEGRHASDLERWRKGPAAPSGRNLEKALELAAEILGVGLGAMPLPPEVPHRRMIDLARYGMQATATTLRRHAPSRQLATLLATVIYLEGKAVDDCLEMLDLLVTTELVGKAETATDKERVRQHPKPASTRPRSPRRWKPCWRSPSTARNSGWIRYGRRSTPSAASWTPPAPATYLTSSTRRRPTAASNTARPHRTRT